MGWRGQDNRDEEMWHEWRQLPIWERPAVPETVALVAVLVVLVTAIYVVGKALE